MRKLTYAVFSVALVVAFYCAYNQGVINERKRWQNAAENQITTVYVPYASDSLCAIKPGHPGEVLKWVPLKQNVVPPSNIRAKVK